MNLDNYNTENIFDSLPENWSWFKDSGVWGIYNEEYRTILYKQIPNQTFREFIIYVAKEILKYGGINAEIFKTNIICTKRYISGIMLKQLRKDLEAVIDKLNEEGLEEILENLYDFQAEDLEIILEHHKAMEAHYKDFEKLEKKNYIQRGSTETPTMPRGVNF